jgi:hypothetical protein
MHIGDKDNLQEMMEFTYFWVRITHLKLGPYVGYNNWGSSLDTSKDLVLQQLLTKNMYVCSCEQFHNNNKNT